MTANQPSSAAGPGLGDVFGSSGDTRGSQRMTAILKDPNVNQIMTNGHDKIFYVDVLKGTVRVSEQIFAGPEQYIDWLNELLLLTDAGYTSVKDANTHVIEASFKSQEFKDLHGSIHLCTREITRGEPILTIRKQPVHFISLDQMQRQGMMNDQMLLWLQQAMRGRLNILISGGSGAGKTTLARALSQYIDPQHRVVTAEEIDELHLAGWLPNVVSLTTHMDRDERGAMIREVSLEQLVKESLRMRPDRIWVGETRGREAYALCKAANSGHDGSVTTLHADDGRQAISQLVTYVMEGGVVEDVARDQVMRAFDIVIQINKVRPDQRVITEITQLEAVREGKTQRLNTIFEYDHESGGFAYRADPTKMMLRKLEKYGVDQTDMLPGHFEGY